MISMQSKKENQIFIFEDDQEIIEHQTLEEKSEKESGVNINPIQLNDQSEKATDHNEYMQQVVSPKFSSLPANKKQQLPSSHEIDPIQAVQSKEPNLVFLQQNAYSFRKDLPEASVKRTKQVHQGLQMISDFNEQISNNDALIQENRVTTEKSNQNQRVRRKQSRTKFQDINDENSVKSSKLSQKIQLFNEPQKFIPSIFNQVPREDAEFNKTEDYLKNENDNDAQLVQSLSRVGRNRKQSKRLPPIRSEKAGQIFINTSNILQNQSSMVVLNKKEEMNPVGLTNISSLTQMVNLNQSQNVKRIAEKVVPRGKAFKCVFQRSKQCYLNYSEYSFHFKSMKFILNAKKQYGHINSHYNITASQKQFTKESQNYLGYLVGNFVGSCFNLYRTVGDHDELACTISYETELACSSTFRKIEIYLRNEDYEASELFGANEGFNLKQLYYLGQNAGQNKIIKLINKKPEWSQQFGCYTMNLKGKCKMPSVKNSVLISEDDPQRYVLLFCKTDRHFFCTQISYPLSPFMAMGIILSSFDFKLFCQ